MEQLNVFARLIIWVVGNYFYDMKTRLMAIHTLIALILSLSMLQYLHLESMYI